MSVSVRYILAAIAFGIAALGFFLLPGRAHADCGSCQPPPACNHGCQQPPPCCAQPPILIPPPRVSTPGVVVNSVNVAVQSSSVAVAVSDSSSSTSVTVRNRGVVDMGFGAVAGSSAAIAVEAAQAQVSASDAAVLLQAICVDPNNAAHPASQTFGGRDVRSDYSGELYRCVAGARLRYRLDGHSADCGAGQALWYEGHAVACRVQIARRACNERSLLRRYGAGDKMILIRGAQSAQARPEVPFNAALGMDGGVGQGVY